MREDPTIAKARIVDSFIREFNDCGTALNLDNVAKRIHISKKTIYRYFESKSEIYRFILATSHDYILEKQKEIFDSPNLSTWQKLKELLIIETPYEKSLNFARIYEIRQAEPEVYLDIQRSYRDQWEYFICLFEEGKKLGLIREDISYHLAIAWLSASMESFYRKDVLEKAGLTYHEAILLLADSFLFGVAKENKKG